MANLLAPVEGLLAVGLLLVASHPNLKPTNKAIVQRPLQAPPPRHLGTPPDILST